MYICNAKSENSSAGRARPCQGRGRGFESRFSLKETSQEVFFYHNARMVELVDTLDLKSNDFAVVRVQVPLRVQAFDLFGGFFIT